MLTRGFAFLFALTLASDAAAQIATSPDTPPRRLIGGRQSSPPPRVVCGTTIIAADPRIDEGFVKPAPSGNFTLRAVRPPVCRDSFASRTDDVKLRLPYFLGPKR
jgi:hypothetical protein